MSDPRAGWLLRLAAGGMGVLVTAIVLIAIRWIGSTAPTNPAAPILTVIPLPTGFASPTPPAQPIPTASPTALPTLPAEPTRLFAIGELVEVAGTQGEGLRIRERPSLESTVLLLGLESEVFQVAEGPVLADGLRWWRIATLYDPVETGWAADSFLRSLEP